MMKYLYRLLLVVMLCEISVAVKAQLKISYSNALDKEVMGVTELLNYRNKKFMVTSSDLKTKTPLELEIEGKKLCVLGYRGNLYYLWADHDSEFSLNCQTGELQGGNKLIQEFLKQWKEICFDGYVENVLYNNLYFYTTQLNSTRDTDCHLFLAPDYVKKTNEWKKNQKKLLKTIAKVEPEFTKAFSTYLDYIYWEQLRESTRLLIYYKQKLPDDLVAQMFKMPINEEKFTEQTYSGEWLETYIDVLEECRVIEPTLKDYVYKVGTYFKNDKLREFYVLSQMENAVSRKNMVFFKELYGVCRDLIVSEDGKKKYDNWMEQADKITAANRFDGKPAEDLIFQDTEGKKHHLSDYRGKLVYIDLWATWCGPCKQETSYFRDLAERMKGKNIVFLSLSLDNRNGEMAWKNYVEMHKLKENCEVGWTGNGFSNLFVQRYQIKAIPRFMLVGTDGKMIYHDCWRPSNVQIDELLNAYLN